MITHNDKFHSDQFKTFQFQSFDNSTDKSPVYRVWFDHQEGPFSRHTPFKK